MLSFYLLGSFVAFILNVVYLFGFYIKYSEVKYKTSTKLSMFFWSALIFGLLSWVGVFFLGVSIGVMCVDYKNNRL